MTAGQRPGAAHVAPGGDEVVRVVAFWRAMPDAVVEIREILHELATLTRREDGCLSFEVLEATAKPGQFVLLEEYAGEHGRQRHLRTDHFRELVLDRAVPLLTHRDVEPYEALHLGFDGGPDETQPARTGDY